MLLARQKSHLSKGNHRFKFVIEKALGKDIPFYYYIHVNQGTHGKIQTENRVLGNFQNTNSTNN